MTNMTYATSTAQSINGATRLYTVIADPVAQLRTPELINTIFAEADQNIIAVPFHVSSSDLTAWWSTIRVMKNLAGIGVAMPHKHSVAALCDRLDDAAALIGVVSAVRRENNGEMVGAALGKLRDDG